MSCLGIDTSNYTSSVALTDSGSILKDKRVLLSVKENERGLRQSDALFQHWSNIPALIKELFSEEDPSRIEAVVCSDRPRPQEGSYMPCFTAGEHIAEIIASSLGIKLIKLSHQEGHILAAAYGNDIDFHKAFFCAHLSGGTLEIVRIEGGKINIAADTLDISYGQLIDRTGVMMGLSFPCGKAVDALACSCDTGEKNPLPKISVIDNKLNISGIETAIKKLVGNMSHEEISFFMMQRIAESFDILTKDYDDPMLLCGGVASSEFLRRSFKNRSFIFGKKELCSDNACGLALSKGERPWL